jgi:hypothetical protein
LFIEIARYEATRSDGAVEEFGLDWKVAVLVPIF